MGNSYKASCARLGQAVICNFWHLGTLTSWASECPDVKNYNTNDGLTHMATVSGKGPKYQTEWESHNNSSRQTDCQLVVLSLDDIVCRGRQWRRMVHCERRYVKDETVIADPHRLVMAEVWQRNSVGRAVTTEYLQTSSSNSLLLTDTRTDAWSTPSDLNECTLSVLCPCQHSIGDMGDGFYR